MSLTDSLTPVATSDAATSGIPDERLQQILESKDCDAAHASRDEDGNTPLA